MTDTLSIRWGKRERDMLIDYPSKPDGWLVHDVFFGDRCRLSMEGPFNVVWDPSLVKQLEERGYDLTTLKFSIKRKAP